MTVHVTKTVVTTEKFTLAIDVDEDKMPQTEMEWHDLYVKALCSGIFSNKHNVKSVFAGFVDADTNYSGEVA